MGTNHCSRKDSAPKEVEGVSKENEESRKGKKVNRKDGKGRVEKEPMTVSSLYILYTPQC